MVEYQRVFGHVGFFFAWDRLQPQEIKPMDKSNSTMAQQLAQAASAFEQQRTGHVPTQVGDGEPE